jgi:UMF1 family MFS transporter
MLVTQAFWFLAVLIGLPFPLMLMVDVERGRRDGIAMAKELEEAEALETSHHYAHAQPAGPIHLVDDTEDDEIR